MTPAKTVATTSAIRRVRPFRLRVLVLAAAAAFALAGCNADGEAQAAGGDEKKQVDAVPVEVAEAQRRAVAASYSGTAPLEARAEAMVVAKTSGIALSVLAEVGDQVGDGEVLVRLDGARAALEAAQTAAQMHKLEANYARSRQLAEQQLVSANDNEQLRYDLENARAANRLANLELSWTTVTAPIAGVVAERMIKPGNFVQANTPIFRIVDDARLEAELNVPERELATLEAGLPVRLTVDALPGRVFEGRIDRVSPVVDSESGTFRVIAAFAGKGDLKPGMFGRISIDYDQRADALTVPRTALLEDEAEPAVFVVEEGKARRVPIELGYLDGEWAEVRGGLEEGARVVTAGKVTLRDGSAVQVIGGQAGGEGQAQVAAADAAGTTP
ncbi:MAG TPA: efflux RND transporter periplasmic adaptor subunit [Xanthomonadaceae bacterium]|nr:efflux RND transporter periplasmic adaptor subunit [Xanthomonadaceae bacterium]